MSAKGIWNAFCARIATFGASKALPVRYYGDESPAPPGEVWLYVAPFWTGAGDLGMASGSDSWDAGMMRVYVYGKQGVNVQRVMDVVDGLVGLFPINTTFDAAKTERTPIIGGPIQEPESASYFMYVTVFWRAVR